MRIFSMLAAAFGAAFVPLLSRGQSFPSHPGGPPNLPRGQASSPGIMGKDNDPRLMGKGRSRRDRHLATVAMLNEQFNTKAKPVKARKPRPMPVYHTCDIDGGAATLIGRKPRRIWLGGVSAQRGY